MIHVVSQRIDCVGGVMVQNLDVPTAFNRLIMAEIGFDTKVLELSNTKIVLHTPLLFNGLDAVEYTGNEVEMAALVRAVSIYLKMRRDFEYTVTAEVTALPLPSSFTYDPTPLRAVHGMIRGVHTAPIIALLTLGIDPATWPRLSDKDTMAALQLQLETGQPALSLV